MQIAQDSVALIDYTLTNDAGEVIDSSNGGEPLAYLHGHHNIIPGLEKALLGKATGDSLKVSIAPAEGYSMPHAPALTCRPASVALLSQQTPCAKLCARAWSRGSAGAPLPRHA